jgi:hypothetical protein
MKTFKDFRNGTITESPVDGVSKGSLEGDKHMCASKIMHREWNEGKPRIGEHAEPDQFGKVSWYKVMFEHGIETVEVDDPNVEIIEEGSHGNHAKKPAKKY